MQNRWPADPTELSQLSCGAMTDFKLAEELLKCKEAASEEGVSTSLFFINEVAVHQLSTAAQDRQLNGSRFPVFLA